MTGIATVELAMTVKTRIEVIAPLVANDAEPIDTPAAMHMSRFFGLIAASANPRPNPLAAVISSTACIPLRCFVLAAAPPPLLDPDGQQEDTES